ncbi:hypothetical protein K0M31_014958 [Melipona bicolor]|uniref:Uncharacterized protein n=1 Tax=Melipona bicolor TaxID=60889 RepID=A0AA40FGT5_9HYME|nr:hypothetical protein K0M31_014958 [Melipona bicolor]
MVEKVRSVAMFLGHGELNLFSPDLNDLRLWTAMSLNLGSPLELQLTLAHLSSPSAGFILCISLPALGLPSRNSSLPNKLCFSNVQKSAL